MSKSESADGDGIEEFEPADDYDGYFARIAGAVEGPTDHIVDTTTFDNSGQAPADYEGHSACVGAAKTLCGHELFGRMIPLESNKRQLEMYVCGNCLRALRAREITEAEA